MKTIAATMLAIALMFSCASGIAAERALDNGECEFPSYEFVATGRITMIGWNFILLQTPATFYPLENISNFEENLYYLKEAASRGQRVYIRLFSEPDGSLRIAEFEPIDP